MKYYYTDPLKAAWMYKHYGVKLTVFCNSQNKDLPCSEDDGNLFDAIELFFDGEECGSIDVHLDSYHIFAPQEDRDVVMGDVCAPTYLTEKQEGRVEFLKELVKNGLIKIIQRNGKAFFMPEVSND